MREEQWQGRGRCSSSGYHGSPPDYLLATFLVTPPTPRDTVSLVRLSLPHILLLKGASHLIYPPPPQTKQLFEQGALGRLRSYGKQVQLLGRQGPGEVWAPSVLRR